MIFLRSTVFNLVFYAWSAFSVIFFSFLFLLPRRHLQHAQWRWAGQVNWLMEKITNTKVEIRGRELLPDRPCIIASKHQSAWDTISWLNTVRAAAIVLKSDLLWIPIYGQMCLKSGMIIVDRKGQAKALKKLIADSRQALDDGRHVLIFPQGTRTAPGETTEAKPYQAGISALYSGLDTPVVPVALNSGVFWPRRGWLHYPGTIVVEFLPPIEPGLKRREFLSELEARIETATDRLVAEAGDVH